MSTQLYILNLDVNISDQTGIDLAGTMDKLNDLLVSYAEATTCVYKYKVSEI